MKVRTRALAVLVLVLGGFAVSPASAGNAGIATLAGETFVSGSRSASIAVRLPHSVTFEPNDARVTFTGRLTQLYLKRDGTWNAPALNLSQFGKCGSSGCTPLFPHESINTMLAGSTGNYTFSPTTLPAGRYRLYLVVDGGPVNYQLHLAGLPGILTLRPSAPIGASVLNAPPDSSARSGSPLLFSGGSEHRVGPHGGYNGVIVWSRHLLPAQDNVRGLCLYYPGAQTVAPISRFQAPCRNNGATFLIGGGYQSSDPVDKSQFYTEILTGYGLPPGVPIGSGGYIESATPPIEVYSQQLWLDFSN